jgi:hypothetical protein
VLSGLCTVCMRAVFMIFQRYMLPLSLQLDLVRWMCVSYWSKRTVRFGAWSGPTGTSDREVISKWPAFYGYYVHQEPLATSVLKQ